MGRGGAFWSLKPALPKDAGLPDSEQMLTNTRHKHTGGTSCALINVSMGACVRSSFFFFFLHEQPKTAGAELRPSRTGSRGHLPVRGSTQKSDKAKLLFIRQLPRRSWRDRSADHQFSPALFPLSLIPAV